MSTALRNDALVHDEFLRTALRYAPDHGLTPPSSITHTILSAARRAHRPAQPATVSPPIRAMRAGRTRWRHALRFLGSPRWAGGFASGLIVALAFGLWIDRDLPDPAPPPDPTRGAAARRDATPDSATVFSSPTAPRAGDPVETPREAVPPSASTEAPAHASIVASAGGDRVAVGGDVQTSPVAGALPQPRSVAPPIEAATGGATQAAASPALTLLRRLRAESAAKSAQWTWQPPGVTAPRPVDAAGQAWLLRLVQAARGRWADVAVPSDPGAATEARWWRDGQPHARLRIEAGGLRWLEPSGRIRFAPLDPAALEPLRSF